MNRLKIILLVSVIFLSFVSFKPCPAQADGDSESIQPSDMLLMPPAQKINTNNVVEIGGKRYLQTSLEGLNPEERTSSLLWIGYVGGYAMDKDGRWINIKNECIGFNEMPLDWKIIHGWPWNWNERYVKAEFNGEEFYINVKDCRTIYAEILNPDLPQWEENIIGQVAKEYSLNGTAKLLLYVIRKVENGGDGKEFGVLDPQAQIYAGNKERSFRLQAEWAAATIQKRFDGDLQAFADRWAPIGAANDPEGKNKNWFPNATRYMSLWIGSLIVGNI